MASKSRKICLSCARAKSAIASRNDDSFWSARGLPYFMVKQMRRYSSREECRSWMLSCRNLLSRTSITSSSQLRADTFFLGLAGRNSCDNCVAVSSCLILAGEPRMAKSEVCLAAVISLEQSCEFSSYNSRTRSSSSPVYSRLIATSRLSRAITLSFSDSNSCPSVRLSSRTNPSQPSKTSLNCPIQLLMMLLSQLFSLPITTATLPRVQSQSLPLQWRRELARMTWSSRQRLRY